MIGAFSFSPDRLEVMTVAGRAVLEVVRLYDDAPCRFDPVSGQRLGDSLDGLDEPRLTAVTKVDAGLRLEFNDQEAVDYELSELEALAFDTRYIVEPRLWQAADATTVPVFDYADVVADDDGLYPFLHCLAQYGFARLKGAPAEPGCAERLIERFGLVRETNYGRVFDVRTKPRAENLADSDRGLEVNTDNPYRFTPPDIQVLHALEVAQSGGQSLLVDGFAAAEALRSQDPQAHACLAEVPVPFRWSDSKVYLSTLAPVLTLDQDGCCRAVRFNNRAQHGAPEPGPKWRRAARRFAALMADKTLTFRFLLGAGDMVIMDNARVLHGRESFGSGSGARWLQGAYADRDGPNSARIRIHRERAARAVDDLETLFASPACSGHYGEQLSLRDHMLQTADTVRADGGAPSLIAAALLHDLGWLDHERGHEDSGARRLSRFFGPEVCEPVRLHVLAKRYLVAKEPDYASRLSQASIFTLNQQGGPLPHRDWAKFEAEPYFDDALALRRAEDRSKSDGAPATPFADYKPMLRRLIDVTAKSRTG